MIISTHEILSMNETTILKFNHIAWFVCTGGQQLIVFPLPISAHEILSMSESTVLKFNYCDLFVPPTMLVYKYRLHWLWSQLWHQTLIIWNKFNS